MIGTIARLTRWEWFKLRRRWMPWILLVILLLFSQLSILGSYFTYRQLDEGGRVAVGALGGPRGGAETPTLACADILAEPPRAPDVDPALLPALRAQCAQAVQQRAAALPMAYGMLTPTGAITQALSIASGIGGVLVAVLAASTVGVEYGWGTVRTVLVRGTGRWQYLAGKFAVLILVALGALVVVAAGAAVSSVIARSLVAPPDGVVAPAWSAAAEAIGRAWYGFVPMIALVVFFTVLSTSTATGMAIGIGYTIAEPLILVLLRQLSDRFDVAADYLLAANISGWTGGQQLGGGADALSSTHHFVVLLVYTGACVAASVWLLGSRDITKGTGT